MQGRPLPPPVLRLESNGADENDAAKKPLKSWEVLVVGTAPPDPAVSSPIRHVLTELPQRQAGADITDLLPFNFTAV